MVRKVREGFQAFSGVRQSGEMGSCEEGKSDKSSSSPTRDQQNNVHVYPDWAAMQAYYGSGVALPPYFNSAVANGHPPPYMWGQPQMMMPPYGAPYAAIYPAGGVYAHPAVPYGSQPLGQAAPSSGAVTVTLAGTALSMEAAAKSSGNTDQGSVKKLKSFGGLAISIGNGSSEKAEVAAEIRLLQSSEGDGSSNGTGQSTDAAVDHKRKQSHEGTPPAAGNDKAESKPTLLPAELVNSTSEKVLGFPVSAVNGGGEMVGAVLAHPSKANPAAVASPIAVVSSEVWLHNDRELKRERRKLSNRESARRSRLRKQAEAEELGKRVKSLSAENATLRTEINQLLEDSEKLRQENAGLMEKLKGKKRGGQLETSSSKTAAKKTSHVNTDNMLSRVDSCGARNSEEGADVYDKGSNSGAKLHQLLDASSRADAVAAG